MAKYASTDERLDIEKGAEALKQILDMRPGTIDRALDTVRIIDANWYALHALIDLVQCHTENL